MIKITLSCLAYFFIPVVIFMLLSYPNSIAMVRECGMTDVYLNSKLIALHFSIRFFSGC